MGKFCAWVVLWSVFSPDDKTRVEVRHIRAHFDICYNGDLFAASPFFLGLHWEGRKRL